MEVSFNGTADIDLPGVNTAGNQDTTGNASSATALATARNIGGVSFDGTSNIDLPGVNTAGNQDTTGNASTAAALATARNIGGVSFDGTSNIDLPGVNITGSQNTTGNAATATALATARNIGGVSFNGTADIDLPGVNTAGNQDTTGNAATATKIANITNNNIVQLTDTQTLSNKTLASPTITGSTTFNGNINATGQQITCEYINATNNVGIGQNYDGYNRFTVVGISNDEPSLSVNQGNVAIRAKASEQGEALYVNGTSLLSDTTVEGDLIMKYNYNDISANGQLKVGENATFYRNVFIPRWTSQTTNDYNNPSFIAPHTDTAWSLSRRLDDLENIDLSAGTGIKIENTTPNRTISLDENADVSFKSVSLTDIYVSGNFQGNINFPGDFVQGGTDALGRYSSNITVKDRSNDGKGNNITISAGNGKGGVSYARGGDVVLKGGEAGNTGASTSSYNGQIQFKSPVQYESYPAYIKEVGGKWYVEYSSSFMMIAHAGEGPFYLDFITRASGHASMREGSILYLGMRPTNTPISNFTITVRNNQSVGSVPGASFGGINLANGISSRVLYPPNHIEANNGYPGRTAGSILVLLWLNNMWKEVSYTP